MSPVVINNLIVAYTIPALNETTINITWSPPFHPNGELIGFIVRIATDAITSERYAIFVINKATYTLIYGGLSKYKFKRSLNLLYSTSRIRSTLLCFSCSSQSSW